MDISSQYTRSYLLSCRENKLTFDPRNIDISTWDLIRRRTKRSRRSGVRERDRRRGFKPALPSIVLMNAQSVRNKIDELETSAKYLRQFREACLIGLAET